MSRARGRLAAVELHEIERHVFEHVIQQRIVGIDEHADAGNLGRQRRRQGFHLRRRYRAWRGWEKNEAHQVGTTGHRRGDARRVAEPAYFYGDGHGQAASRGGGI